MAPETKSNVIVLMRVCPECKNRKPLAEFPLEHEPPETCIECQGRRKEFPYEADPEPEPA